MAGWGIVYALLGPDGGIVPVTDRDDQVFDAARQLGLIDWSGYLTKGVWNDTHDEAITVGLPETLEFHDDTTELAKAHGKVGYWTTGHLLDRDDPTSWDLLGRTPRPHELDRADYFWDTAHLLKGTPRPIAFSAHGSMRLSPCRKRITYAKVDAFALCDTPINPGATAEPMQLGRRSPVEILRKAVVGGDPCRSCRCPPGACQGLLRKGTGAGLSALDLAPLTPENLEAHAITLPPDPLVQSVMDRARVDRETAERWCRQHTARQEPAHAAA